MQVFTAEMQRWKREWNIVGGFGSLPCSLACIWEWFNVEVGDISLTEFLTEKSRVREVYWEVKSQRCERVNAFGWLILNVDGCTQLHQLIFHRQDLKGDTATTSPRQGTNLQAMTKSQQASTHFLRPEGKKKTFWLTPNLELIEYDTVL